MDNHLIQPGLNVRLTITTNCVQRFPIFERLPFLFGGKLKYCICKLASRYEIACHARKARSAQKKSKECEGKETRTYAILFCLYFPYLLVTQLVQTTGLFWSLLMQIAKGAEKKPNYLLRPISVPMFLIILPVRGAFAHGKKS